MTIYTYIPYNIPILQCSIAKEMDYTQIKFSSFKHLRRPHENTQTDANMVQDLDFI